jgi:glutathione S-transferase
MEAAVLQVYEGRWRPQDRHEPKWLEHQQGKVESALKEAEAKLSKPGPNLHIGHVALACALGYLDMRFEGRWRQSYPKLVSWLDDFEGRVPAFAETRFVP